MSTVGQVYEPSWLLRLREIDPLTAAKFDNDDDRVSRMDLLLQGIGSAETRAELVRIAYNAGLAPDDPLVLFNLQMLGIQKLARGDFEETLKSLERIATITANTLETLEREVAASAQSLEDNMRAGSASLQHEQREAAAAIEDTAKAAIAEIKDQTHSIQAALVAQTSAIRSITEKAVSAVDQLPDIATTLRENLTAEVQTMVGEETKRYVPARVTELAREAIAGAEKEAIALATDIATMSASLKPIRIGIDRLTTAEQHLFAGFKLFARERTIAIVSGLVGAAISAAAVLGFVGLGGVVNPDTASMVRAGHFYFLAYGKMSRACQDQVDHLSGGAR
jgi:hypothetical protein